MRRQDIRSRGLVVSCGCVHRFHFRERINVAQCKKEKKGQRVVDWGGQSPQRRLKVGSVRQGESGILLAAL
jgi:hypothetical protein